MGHVLSLQTMMIRLSQWASEQGISYRTAWRWIKQDRIRGLIISPTGRLFVETEPTIGASVALYARVSSQEQCADLERQMDRLRDFAAAQGFTVAREITEIGNGLDGHCKRLIQLLQDPKIKIVMVEYRDRLTRFGTEYIEAALTAQGRSILILNEGEQKLDLVQDFVDVATSLCSSLYGRRSAKNRAEQAVKAAEGILS